VLTVVVGFSLTSLGAALAAVEGADAVDGAAVALSVGATVGATVGVPLGVGSKDTHPSPSRYNSVQEWSWWLVTSK
jgi:hypothetical protein